MDSPIFLQYHKVTTKIEIGGTWVHPAIFKRHVNFLVKRGIPSLTRDDLKNLDLDRRAVLFTFDDAYSCVYQNAFPILKSAGYVGAVFVITDFIGRENTWDINFGLKFRHLGIDELRKLHREGWIVGSHSHTHKDLTRLSDEDLIFELKKSKEVLEEILGDEVFAIAYPYGKYSLRVVKMAQRVGYRMGFATHKGKKYKGFEYMTVHRRGVYVIDFSIWAKVYNVPIISQLEGIKEYLISKTADLSPVVKDVIMKIRG